MPVPKRKRSKSRRDKRFANKGLKLQAAGTCQNCNTHIQSHAACQKCGHYKGKQVMRTKGERSATRQETRTEKQIRAQAKHAAAQAHTQESSDSQE